MDIILYPGALAGTIQAIPSKSQAHRLLICAAFADSRTTLLCPETNQDIEATAACLRALGARIRYEQGRYTIDPVEQLPECAAFPCCESGSTLRFMLPIAGALGVDTVFTMDGRLPQRPLSPLWEEMERMGCRISRPTETTVRCQAKLKSGIYTIDGGVSSQFISGLLFAMALMDGDNQLAVTGKAQSQPYIKMTQEALKTFGVSSENYRISGHLPFHSPGRIQVEGDWSNAAFFLAANTLGSNVVLSGLSDNSPQGDRAVVSALKQLEHHCTISAAQIPDLIPILSVVAAAKGGAVFTDIQRLRLKESDRVASVMAMLQSLGINSEATASTLIIYPGKFSSGTVDSARDHRIAMSAAIAATIADGPVIIRDAQCVAKSYPSFWEEYRRLGGNYEQHLRNQY